MTEKAFRVCKRALFGDDCVSHKKVRDDVRVLRVAPQQLGFLFARTVRGSCCCTSFTRMFDGNILEHGTDSCFVSSRSLRTQSCMVIKCLAVKLRASLIPD